METSRQLTEMAMGYFRSRVLAAAARLNIADALAQGEQTVAQLAATTQAEPESLHRLLRALASIGLLQESRPASFTLTDLGQALRSDHPHSARPSVVFWADLLADSWSHLTHCVRTGDSSFTVMEQANIQPLWARDPEANSVFRQVMGTAPAEQYDAIAKACQLQDASTVADLGGGGGTLLLAILNQHPNLNGILVERPESVEAARPRLTDPRLQLIAADLLQTPPPPADCFLLKQVLHGYKDDKVLDILHNCAQSLPPNGRLLIIECVIPTTIDQADPGLEAILMSDLNMLAVTGGKERTESEWRALIAEANLNYIGIQAISGETCSIIEAKR